MVDCAWGLPGGLCETSYSLCRERTEPVSSSWDWGGKGGNESHTHPRGERPHTLRQKRQDGPPFRMMCNSAPRQNAVKAPQIQGSLGFSFHEHGDQGRLTKGGSGIISKMPTAMTNQTEDLAMRFSPVLTPHLHGERNSFGEFATQEQRG